MTQKPPKPYRKWPVQAAVLGVVAFLFGMAWLPAPNPNDVKAAAARFRFEPKTLVRPAVPQGLTFPINPYGRHLIGWLYNMGASIAMADLDGDGLANDLCYTDIRAKALMIAPVPGTGDRYQPFSFNFGDYVDLATSYPMRCGVSDMNEDGLQDIYVGFAGRAPLLLLRKDHGATGPEPLTQDAFVIQELMPDGKKTWLHSTTSCFTDVDGDGHLDLIVGNYFEDGADLFNENSTHEFEMNDTFVRARNGGKDRIFLWAGAKGGEKPEVTYKDAGDDVWPGTSAFGWTFAIGAADLDHDGLSELYIANDYGPDTMFLNRSTPGKVHFVELFGEEGFATPRSYVLGKDSFKGMGIDFADINRDGMFDMVVSNISNDWVLGESHFLWVSTGDPKKMEQGIAPYVNRAPEMGVWHSAWAWDIRFDDFDNDGEMEIVQAVGYMKGSVPEKFLIRGRWTNLQQFVILNDRMVHKPSSWGYVPFDSEIDGHIMNPFYTLGPDGKYMDIAEEVFHGALTNTRGIATADVDGDGDLDMTYVNAWEDSQFFENKSPQGTFLGLHLLLPLDPNAATGSVHDGHPKWKEGTPAVGTMVEFTHPDGRRMSRQVDGGNGHSGSRSPDLIFGLGKLSADTPIQMKLTWRDRKGTVHRTDLQLKPGWHTVTLAANMLDKPTTPEAVKP